MESIKNLGETYVKGEIINLRAASINSLEDKIDEIEVEEKNIKNEIFSILELF